jgi:DNA invertase Pin-like site-specific DNA recombinase
MKVARIYLRVSTDEQDLTRQAEIEHSARSAGYYIAGVYREKASGARADRPEILRMIADLQPGEVVVAEKIDRISRLPLAEAQKLVASIRSKGARLAVPGRDSPARPCDTRNRCMPEPVSARADSVLGTD